MRLWRGSGLVLTAFAIAVFIMRRLTQVRNYVRSRPLAALTPYGCPTPAVVHRRIDRVKPGRLIIVGDLHGTPELFTLLSQLQYNPAADNLVLAGDLVNKGPVSLAVLDAVLRLNCWAVRGNHDDAVLSAWLKLQAGQLLSPKYEWVREMSEAQAAVLSVLPFSVSLPEYGVAVVHAGLVPGVPLEDQDLWSLYKMRNLVAEVDQEGTAAGTAGQRHIRLIRYRPVEKAKDGGRPWVELWRGPPHVFFGHDARRRLQLGLAATGLDTGCVYGGQLTAAVVPPLTELRRRSVGFVAKMAAGEAVSREDLMVELVSVPAAAVYVPTTESAAGAVRAAGVRASGQ